ncbi:hypothetical protein PSEUDO8O_50336 [Pseudomonas sp. 8O]|nr:hypothetical protein PSEUDO8O_50336 [Pseudomonas sp. 8O]
MARHAEAGVGYSGNRCSTGFPSTVPVSRKRISRSRPTTTCRWCEVKAPRAREERSGFSRVEFSYGSFQCALNLPDDAKQDSKREASAPKHGRSIPIEVETDIPLRSPRSPTRRLGAAACCT